ncbi:MAG TPA: DUF1080 domain-containing protein [Bryobacteraceae bacterium]|nr:DUF1080 domain-containing protein [Bryobacteraceae bacterium]
MRLPIAGILSLALLAPAVMRSQDWLPLFNGKDLDGWQVRGAGEWAVMKDGTVVGKRVWPDYTKLFTFPITAQQFRHWLGRQAWLYTIGEFGEFDLHVEYWIPPGGNSGVSIRDVSRAHYSIGNTDEPDPVRTTLKGSPAHIGYEIQIIDPDKQKYPSGSIYLFAAAKQGVQKSSDWNSMDIESRNDRIRVKLNGEMVAASPGDPARSKVGPIGLQLHDQFSMAMFRNLRIREIKKE